MITKFNCFLVLVFALFSTGCSLLETSSTQVPIPAERGLTETVFQEKLEGTDQVLQITETRDSAQKIRSYVLIAPNGSSRVLKEEIVTAENAVDFSLKMDVNLPEVSPVSDSNSLSSKKGPIRVKISDAALMGAVGSALSSKADDLAHAMSQELGKNLENPESNLSVALAATVKNGVGQSNANLSEDIKQRNEKLLSEVLARFKNELATPNSEFIKGLSLVFMGRLSQDIQKQMQEPNNKFVDEVASALAAKIDVASLGSAIAENPSFASPVVSEDASIAELSLNELERKIEAEFEKGDYIRALNLASIALGRTSNPEKRREIFIKFGTLYLKLAAWSWEEGKGLDTQIQDDVVRIKDKADDLKEFVDGMVGQ